MAGTTGGGRSGSRPSAARDPVKGSVVPALMFLVLLAGFVTVTLVVILDGKGPLPVDVDLHAWMLAHRTPGLTRAALALTATGSGVPAYVLAALAGWFAAGGSAARRGVGATIALGALLVGQGIRLLIVTAVDRPRPPTEDWAGAAAGPAYPSGHTTTSALVAALICVAAAAALHGRVRRPVQVAAVCWAGLVGGTRVYLGVHWPTDVLAGWLLAAALVLAGALLCRRVALFRDLRPAATARCDSPRDR